MEAMMTLKKKTSAIMIAVVMTVVLVMMAAPTFAADHPILDVDATGSITMSHTANDTGEPIAGSTMTLYKVADAVIEDGGAVFAPVDGLDSDSIRKSMNEVTEADAGSFELASTLESMVAAAGITGEDKITDADGIVTWADLSVGLYLIVNTQPAEGYEAIPSFVISVPRLLDGEYEYHVTTIPKPAPATEIPEDPEEPDEPDLPQTGQLWWPVPVFAGFGLLLLGIGIYRRKRA